MKSILSSLSVALLFLVSLSRCGDGMCTENCDQSNASTFNRNLSHVAFVTSLRVSGNFGGTAGADGICQKLASEGKITKELGGTWKSILSDSQTNAYDRVPFITGLSLRNTREDLVAQEATEIWSKPLLAPIQYDQDGKQIKERMEVWTGSDANGKVVEGPSLVTNCSNWNDETTVANGGNVGLLTGTDKSWIQSDDFVGCSKTDGKARLYCVNVQ